MRWMRKRQREIELELQRRQKRRKKERGHKTGRDVPRVGEWKKRERES